MIQKKERWFGQPFVAQYVTHSWKNMNPLFTMVDELYKRISANLEGESLIPLKLDSSFKSLCDILSQYVYHFSEPEYTEVDVEPIKVDNAERNTIVCLSGGKDSVATALLYKKLGYNVYLYHLYGINRGYLNESSNIPEIAKMLDCEYFVDSCTLHGQHEFFEHPMKNMIIANGALHWGISKGIGTDIAFGNFQDSYLADNQFDVCAGDCVEMWKAYEAIISRFIDGFTIHMPLPNTNESLYMMESHPDLLAKTISCILPYRFQLTRKQTNEYKFGIKLPDNRCGSCWKCCMEYIYYADHGVYEYHHDYYLHCLVVLAKCLYKETGKHTKNIEEVWNMYLFYDIHKSKAYEELKNATVYKSGIRIKGAKQIIK
jgi:hypothetical protein